METAMTKYQREELNKVLGTSGYANRTFFNNRIWMVNHYDTKLFNITRPVKLDNINAKLAIKMWKLL